MSPQTTTTHTVKYVQMPGGELLRAPEGCVLDVTITCRTTDAGRDELLRDVGRPNWPHRNDQ